jgi:hypothetical protein
MLVVLLTNQKDYRLRLRILLFYFFSASLSPPHVSALYKYIRIYLYAPTKTPLRNQRNLRLIFCNEQRTTNYQLAVPAFNQTRT